MGIDANGERGVAAGRGDHTAVAARRADQPAVGARHAAPLRGRKLYIPQMSYSGAAAFAAAFRSVGIDAEVCPDSDSHTLELGRRHTSGEECLPACVTLGNFLKIMERPDFDPPRAAFFMPTADGPCRFGQYAPYIRKVLRDIGMDDVLVFSPTSKNGYEGMAEQKNELMRNALRALAASDMIRKMLHRTRPYETRKGDTDEVFARAIKSIERVIERQGVPTDQRMKDLVAALTRTRDEFRAVPADHSRWRPLVGVVGEIFCRLTPFTNDHTIRKLEEYGAECTLAHVAEWLWYTNDEQQKRLRQIGKRFSKAMLGAKIKDYIQHKDEERIHHVFHEDFRGYEEPPIRKVLEYSRPYLPSTGALGEMTLSVGKAVFHYHQGCDGVVDISPFTCMNGIVTEAVYPRVSADHDHMPIRNFFFDGTQTDLDRDVAIFVELARAYQARKKTTRIYPANFAV
jgi:predicted nucleotide-binding protein (sugar kinase/HSP70/actin superfamily)